MDKFKPDVTLDATLIKAAADGGKERFLATAFLLRDAFPGGPSQAVRRSDWLKTQPKEYQDQVVQTVMVMDGHADAELPNRSRCTCVRDGVRCSLGRASRSSGSTRCEGCAMGVHKGHRKGAR